MVFAEFKKSVNVASDGEEMVVLENNLYKVVVIVKGFEENYFKEY